MSENASPGLHRPKPRRNSEKVCTRKRRKGKRDDNLKITNPRKTPPSTGEKAIEMLMVFSLKLRRCKEVTRQEFIFEDIGQALVATGATDTGPASEMIYISIKIYPARKKIKTTRSVGTRRGTMGVPW